MVTADRPRPPPPDRPWNRALVGAFNKGWNAGYDGQPATSCPYEDKRKWCGRLTWSRSFIAAWDDGWELGRKARKTATKGAV